MGSFARVAIYLLACYGIYCLLLFLFQRTLIYPKPTLDRSVTRETDRKDKETWWLETGSGKIEAWFFPSPLTDSSSPSPVVIFAHGNAEIIDDWPHDFKRFLSMGVSVLLVEYPGYGRSDGTPSQASITEAFLVAYDRLAVRPDVDKNRIVLVGRSLGGGVACAVAAKRPSAALILMSSFTSIRAFAWRFLVPPFFVRDAFDNLSVVRNYEGPVLIFHGRHDTIIPYSHGQALSRTVKNGKMITYDCRHNDCPPSWETFFDDVYAFFLEARILHP
jgi:pimeloyl-ACP methyl ester carboxylesterase